MDMPGAEESRNAVVIKEAYQLLRNRLMIMGKDQTEGK